LSDTFDIPIFKYPASDRRLVPLVAGGFVGQSAAKRLHAFGFGVLLKFGCQVDGITDMA